MVTVVILKAQKLLVTGKNDNCARVEKLTQEVAF